MIPCEQLDLERWAGSPCEARLVVAILTMLRDNVLTWSMDGTSLVIHSFEMKTVTTGFKVVQTT